jgi:glucose-6-phosphate 1-epimerase
MTVQQLNQQFGLNGELRFVEHSSGLIIMEIDNELAIAKLCLQGAHLMTWRPHSSAMPVVWLSDDVRLAPGSPKRGGTPICWPWFGTHPRYEIDRSYPAHGFARIVPWEVVETASEPDGATRIVLRMADRRKTRKQWPYASEVTVAMVIGETLKISLATTNTGNESFVISEGFHTYFQISDIENITVKGLDGCEYLDKTRDFERLRQHGDIRFDGETDRVYVNTESTCYIEDPAFARRIVIKKSGSESTVVWTPGVMKAAIMGDLGSNNGWRRMVCVESVNAADNEVMVASGDTHILAVEYSTMPHDMPSS